MEYSLHHFVPQFYLARFADSDGLLWVYDKDTGRIFKAAPGNLAAEKGLYTLPDFSHDPSVLEKQFSDLEQQAALITEDWLDQLSQSDSVEIPAINREIMSLYLTTQLLRTSEARTMFLQGHSRQALASVEQDDQRAAHIFVMLRNDELVSEVSTWIHKCA